MSCDGIGQEQQENRNSILGYIHILKVSIEVLLANIKGTHTIGWNEKTN